MAPASGGADAARAEHLAAELGDHATGVGRVVNIVGNIGSGKSTSVRELAARLGATPYQEDYAANPYLELFYAEPRRWAFRSQLHFLTESAANDFRARQRGATSITELGSYFVHAVMTAEMHSQGLLLDTEFAFMDALARTLTSELRPPDLLVVLHASTGELMRRIRERGREFELGIEEDYLDRITRRYEAVAARWDRSPLLRVDAERVDIRTPEGAMWVAERVEAELRPGS